MGIFGKLFGKKEPTQEPPGVGLRLMALTTPVDKLGFTSDDDFPNVYGIITDWNIGEVTATVMSMRDGTASLYTTSTFGVIGGQAHDNVRHSAIQHVQLAEKFNRLGKVVTDFPYPKSGQVHFYILTYGGVRLYVGDESAIDNGSNPDYSLFATAQDVLTNLRLITEKESA